jgi:hypothetical protein
VSVSSFFFLDAPACPAFTTAGSYMPNTKYKVTIHVCEMQRENTSVRVVLVCVCVWWAGGAHL